MSDQEQKQESTGITAPPEADKENRTELSEEELKRVSGGVSLNYTHVETTYTNQG